MGLIPAILLDIDLKMGAGQRESLLAFGKVSIILLVKFCSWALVSVSYHWYLGMFTNNTFWIDFEDRRWIAEFTIGIGEWYQ